MKRILGSVVVAMLTLTAVALFAASALALSDAEYTRLKKNSSEFARADRELTQVWSEAKKVLGKSDFNALKKEQREWIAKGRDQRAKWLMNDGMSRAEAYAEVTRERVKVIRTNIEIARNKARGGKAPRQVNSGHFYAIYERRDGVFMETTGRNNKIRVSFSDYEFKWEGEGTLESQKVVLRDGKNRRLTLTFSQWENGLITQIKVAGSGELDRLDGTYNAYQGHM